MNIKAICFDLDGVYFTPRGKESFHQALTEEFGMPADVRDHLMYKSEQMAQLVRGQISNEDFWDHVRTIGQINATDAELTARWVRDYEIDLDVQRAVHHARAQGYKTCVCTNNNGIRLPALEEKFNFMSDFDFIASSHETGYCKPAPEMYAALLKGVGVAPGELVYADDNAARLAGAQELGIQTFVYEDFPQFLKELAARGVNVT